MKHRCNVLTCSFLLLIVGGFYVSYTIRMTESLWAARKMWQEFKTQKGTPKPSNQRADMIAIEGCVGSMVTTAQTHFAFAAVLTDSPHSTLMAQKLGVSIRQHSQLDMILLVSKINSDERLSQWKQCVGDVWMLPNYYDAVLSLDLDVIALRDPSDIFDYKFESCRRAAVSHEQGVTLLLPGAKPDDDLCELPRSYNAPADKGIQPTTKLLHFTVNKPWLQADWRQPYEMLTCWGTEILCAFWQLL